MPTTLTHLEETDLPAIHGVIDAAFADYVVPVSLDIDGLRRLLVRRGVDYRCSVGAFDGDDLVGVMAVAVDEWQGGTVAYDIVTGVLPTHRGRGLAGRLIEFAIPALRARGARRMLLEVIDRNVAAVRAYRRVGFQKLRDLVCLEVPAVRAEPPPDVDVVDGDLAALREATAWYAWTPTWQNGDAALKRGVEEARVFIARERGVAVGCAAAVAENAELPRLVVRPDRRRRGIARALVAAVSVSVGKPIRVVNIDARAVGDLAFYAALGATERVRQYEMEKPL